MVTGATGALGSALARGLADAGASVAVIARGADRVNALARELDGLAVVADVLERDQLGAARDRVVERWGRVDVLVNAAGGNVAAATLNEGERVFDLPATAFGQVLDLNLLVWLCGRGTRFVTGESDDSAARRGRRARRVDRVRARGARSGAGRDHPGDRVLGRRGRERRARRGTARQAGRRARLLHALATDELGERSRQPLEQLGVRVHAASRSGRQRRGFVHLDADGERTITILGERISRTVTDPLPWEIFDDVDGV